LCRKNGVKLAILTKNTGIRRNKLSEHWFSRKRHFGGENWRKSPEIQSDQDLGNDIRTFIEQDPRPLG
jgi:hypothetical protein